ncbi:MAG: O-antigen ligase family protein [Candidatus Omnitrophica bacterium]|nr:O-antigen ligase family protein [Candidatus Omnitrophota bacterium]MDD5771205.1 O-antigen ligase family protein [Candidatus Omnitrophota bacterium]
MQYLVLALIFIRPFIASLAYPWVNSVYSLALIASLLLWMAGNPAWRRESRNIFLPAAVFILALAVSLYFSIDRSKSVAEIYKYLSALLLILGMQNLTERSRKVYLSAILICGISISIMAIYQYFFGFAHLQVFISKQNITSPFIADYLRQKRVFFPFVTPGILAGYLTMVIPLVLLYKKKVWLSLPLLIALFLTASLGAFISLFLTALVYMLLKNDFKKTKLVFLSSLGVFALLVLIIRSVSGRGHLSPAFSIIMRLSYWQDTLEIIKLHPFLGIGLGNFNLVYSRYAHNSFLQFWAEAGLIGASSLAWLVIACLKRGAGKISLLSKDKEKLLLLSCLAAFLFHNLWDFGFFLPEVSLIWWTILGIFAAPRPKDGL